MLKGWPLCAALGLIGCHSTSFLDLPDVTPPPRSALLLFETPDRPTRAIAIDLSETSFPLLQLEDATRMTILYYDSLLTAQDLEPGVVTLIDPRMSPEVSVRALPTPESIYESPPGAGGRSFAKLDELPESLTMLRIPGFDVATCLPQGGCFDRTPGSDTTVCVVPCQVQAPTPPEPTAPPIVDGACEDGFTATTFRDGEVTVCDPAPRAPTCPPGQMQGRGDLGCRSNGSSCPAGPFSDSLPMGRRVVYVDPTAPAGGAGTLASPFTTLAQAGPTLLTGDVLALAKGTHRGALDLANFPTVARLSIVGACTELTIVQSPDTLAPLRLRGVVDVRGLTLTGSGRGLRALSAGTRVSLRRVLVDAPLGIWVTAGARVDGSELRSRDLRPAVGTVSHLFEVDGATIAIDASTLELGTDGYHLGSTEARDGVYAVNNSRVTLRDFVIVGGLRAINAANSDVRIADGVIEQSMKEGIRIATAPALLEVDHLVMRDVGVAGLVGDAAGLTITGGAVGDLKHSYFRNTFNRAIYMVTATATISDIVVDGAPGVWIRRCSAQQPQTLLERIHLESSGSYGMIISERSVVRIHDLWLRGAHHADFESGNGLLNDDSTVLVEGCDIEDGSGRGIFTRPAAVTTLYDCRVSGFRIGIGLYATGGVLELDRVEISESRAVGLCLAPEGSADLHNLRVSRTGQTGQEDGFCPALASAGGAGILVSADKPTRLSNFLLDDNKNIGINLFGLDTFDASDGVVRGNGIGLRVPPGFDLSGRLQRVRFEGNVADVYTE